MKKLGFGFMRLPVLDENDRSTVDIPLTEKMVRLYLERGFTYFDTAHRYKRRNERTRSPSNAYQPLQQGQLRIDR